MSYKEQRYTPVEIKYIQIVLLLQDNFISRSRLQVLEIFTKPKLHAMVRTYGHLEPRYQQYFKNPSVKHVVIYCGWAKPLKVHIKAVRDH